MMFLFIAHHTARIANAIPPENINIPQTIAVSIDIVAGTIALIAAIAYIWADRKDQKEIDEILRKNGIKNN
jgi:hypothetical protein